MRLTGAVALCYSGLGCSGRCNSDIKEGRCPLENIRSLLFVPGNRPDMLDKAKTLPADVLVPDLEDSVPTAEKDSARRMVRDRLPELAQTGRCIIPRINDLSTGLAHKDLVALVSSHIYGVNVGKVDTPQHVRILSQMLADLEKRSGLDVGKIKLIPYIESAVAVLNAFPIAGASSRIIGIAFGAEDFTNDMGIERTKEGEEISNPRATVAIAARAAGVMALDTPYVNFRDHDGLDKDIQRALKVGFNGKFAIHPTQICPINVSFSPSKEAIEYARRVVHAFEEAEAQGRASTSLDGKMIDIPIVKRARNVLAREQPENHD